MSWELNLPITLMLAFALILVLGAVTREKFVPEFLEQSNVKRTADLQDSSYKQETNHIRPDGRFDAPAIEGLKSPFRVNMWDSYIP